MRARDALIRLGAKLQGRVFSYTANGLKSAWRTMIQHHGIEDLHFHDMRHEAISRLFELGTLDMMEIAAISGHKSLSMLKRYTHLKAAKLVDKLEGNRNKGRRVVLSNLVPYPASIERCGPRQIRVRLLDFDELVVDAPTSSEAIERAQDVLLRRIVASIRDSKPIPSPDQYLENIPTHLLVMIDPLAPAPFA